MSLLRPVIRLRENIYFRYDTRFVTPDLFRAFSNAVLIYFRGLFVKVKPLSSREGLGRGGVEPPRA